MQHNNKHTRACIRDDQTRTHDDQYVKPTRRQALRHFANYTDIKCPPAIQSRHDHDTRYILSNLSSEYFHFVANIIYIILLIGFLRSLYNNK